MVKIGASLLSADFSRLGIEVKRAEMGGADFIHFDVMDGHFVPNITFGPSMVRALRNKSELPFHVHLMIENPDLYVEKFVEAGSDVLLVHPEACPHLERTIQFISKQGVKMGVALNPKTPPILIDKVLDEVDEILLMTVEPGFGGQPFIRALLPKIEKAKKMIRERKLKTDLAVDGGVNYETAPLAVRAGANVLVAGSAIYGQRDVKQAIEKLRRSILAVR